MKTRAHYELNFRRGHIDQILGVRKKIINCSESLTTEIYILTFSGTENHYQLNFRRVHIDQILEV